MEARTAAHRNPRSSRHRLALALALVAIAATALTSTVAEARSSRLASYHFDRVWPAALRFLRIDEGHEIVEKDVEAGYVLFELERGDEVHRGSLELVRTRDYAERDSVRLILRIEGRPAWDEEALLERFLAKLRAELGQPRSPPEREEPPEKDPPEEAEEE